VYSALGVAFEGMLVSQSRVLFIYRLYFLSLDLDFLARDPKALGNDRTDVNDELRRTPLSILYFHLFLNLDAIDLIVCSV
jgi:hypothetical protein